MGVVQELLQVCTGKHRPYFVGKEGGDKTHPVVTGNVDSFNLFLRDLCGLQNMIFTDTLGWWIPQIGQWALKSAPPTNPSVPFHCALSILQSVRQAKSVCSQLSQIHISKMCGGEKEDLLRWCQWGPGTGPGLFLLLSKWPAFAWPFEVPYKKFYVAYLVAPLVVAIWQLYTHFCKCLIIVFLLVVFFFLSKGNGVVFVNYWTGLCNAQKDAGVRQPYVGGEGQAFPSSQFLRRGNGQKRKTVLTAKFCSSSLEQH